ncbi:MAG: hypothetical protein U9P90_04425 [Patescibacteria group bacterium]|nr:hypothetical protein [Patescibacteria group bacterium]
MQRSTLRFWQSSACLLILLLSSLLFFIACAPEEDLLLDEIGVDTSALETHGMLPTSGSSTFDLAVYPGDDNYLFMYSPTSGNWKFETWSSPISAGGCFNPDTVVYTYWIDTSDPNDDWHYWPGGGWVCWPTSGWSTNLYSGSSDIAYMFIYGQYGDYGQTVYARFTRQ